MGNSLCIVNLIDNLFMGNQQKFITRLKKLMDENNDNNSTLAKKIGASNQAVSMWLLGQGEPKFVYIENIAYCYDVSIDYLTGKEDY